MKITWGTGIAIFFSIFVLSLIYQVYRSTQYDHSLVRDDYYQEDLNYQEVYDKKANTLELSQQLEITKKEGEQQVRFTFPETGGDIAGQITFFRPSNSSLDFSVPISVTESRHLVIPTETLAPGRWKVKVDWSSGDKKFYSEEIIHI